MNKKFALIGVAGFIAPRHLRAIKETENILVAALDPFDAVGVLDSYFPDCDFFVEFERFDRHIDMLRRAGDKIDFVSICSPNYLHDAHIRFALRSGADAVCEKPVVLNPWNIDALKQIEKESGKRVFGILQLRLHPTIAKLKKQVESSPKDKIFDIDLSYITSRGHWYHYSWKGESDKSGGIATNIGVHFFDMLSWIFGAVKQSEVHLSDRSRSAGLLVLERARVRWFLSINGNDVPPSLQANGQRTYRSITIDGTELEFSDGFADLHTESYRQILAGHGFGLDDARPSIELVHSIREAEPIGLTRESHPFCENTLRGVSK